MKRRKLTVSAIERCLAFSQPDLVVRKAQSGFIIEGKFYVTDGPNDEGPLDCFEIKIEVSDDYPQSEPRVFELGGRIPRDIDRHMYDGPRCCTCVWEEWLAISDDTSFKAFIIGPLRNFFLSQIYYERHKKWPFGERSHGIEGLLESASQILGQRVDFQQAVSLLKAISSREIKGHWLCPYGCGIKLRKCGHRQRLLEQKQMIDGKSARQLLIRLKRIAKANAA